MENSRYTVYITQHQDLYSELHIALNELEEMSAIKLFAILIFLVNSVYWNSASNQDDFYCQAEPLVYDICRRCNSTTEDCETSEKCQCDNIQIAGNAKDLCKKLHIYVLYLLME